METVRRQIGDPNGKGFEETVSGEGVEPVASPDDFLRPRTLQRERVRWNGLRDLQTPVPGSLQKSDHTKGLTLAPDRTGIGELPRRRPPTPPDARFRPVRLEVHFESSFSHVAFRVAVI